MNFEPTWIPTTYQRIPYAPNGSTEHDHLCSCPWCCPDEPDLMSDEEVAQMEPQEDDPYIPWDVEYADVAWQAENPIE